ncbi:hypothetical protein [Uliginosibacterium sp. H1]|uniref:hypothetical protein n=1 Tax=Uliginosibacterium sp. H1 TaxID=3114757 RepID=UPI002E192861|nr:hypothetical protein [Uliginosibacterium sp. H1]
MSHIIAARFATFDQAHSATREAIRAGFSSQDVSTFFVNPPGQNHARAMGGDEFADRGAKGASRTAMAGAAIGACVGSAVGAALAVTTEVPAAGAAVTGAIGAYVGSLMGAMNGTGDARRPAAPGRSLGVRHSGVLVAVRVDEQSDDEAAKVLSRAGGVDVEEAQGVWRDGTWSDFDPVRPPVLSDKVPARTAP